MKKLLVGMCMVLCIISCSKKYTHTELLEVQKKSTCYKFEKKFSICFPDSWNLAKGMVADNIFRSISQMIKRNEHMYIFKHYYADKRKKEYVLYMPRVLVNYCDSSGITNQMINDHIDIEEFIKNIANAGGIRTYTINSMYFNEEKRELYFDISYILTRQLHYFSSDYSYMSYLNEKAPIQTYEYRFKRLEKFINSGSIVLTYDDCYSYVGEKPKEYNPIYKDDFEKIINTIKILKK